VPPSLPNKNVYLSKILCNINSSGRIVHLFKFGMKCRAFVILFGPFTNAMGVSKYVFCKI